MNEVFPDYLHKSEVALSICIAVLLLLWVFIAIRRRLKRTRRRPSRKYHDDGPPYAGQYFYHMNDRDRYDIEVKDIKSKEMSVQHYDIPQGGPKERTAALSRALGHFQKQLHDCCLYVWRYDDDGGYHVIKSEIERLGKNCILRYIPSEDLETMAEFCPSCVSTEERDFPLLYRNITGRQYSGDGSQDEVQAMAECFFHLRWEGSLRRNDILEKKSRAQR